MAELDDQLARLAAHRADSVPPLDPAAARMRARLNARRRITVVAAIAACILALVVGGGFALAGGSDDSPSVHTPANSTDAPAPTTAAPTTAPPTTTAPTSTTVPVVPSCAPLDGAGTAPKEGPAVSGTASASPVLVGVQVQASECADVVLFEFGNGTPEWSATNEPSGSGANEPVVVLRFRSETATSPPPPPSEIRPEVPPSFVLGVTLVPQADGSQAWVIRASSQGDVRPFRVVPHEGALAVEIVRTSGTSRTVTCTDTDGHLEYDVPSDWYVDLTPADDPCRRFAPEVFSVCHACDGPFPYGSIGVRSAAEFDPGPSSVVVSSTDTTVAGRAATVRELEATGYGLFTAGYRTYVYLVDWAPEGTLVISIGGMPGPDFDARKAGVDAIAASVRRID
jgi:hypothetical protein